MPLTSPRRYRLRGVLELLQAAFLGVVQGLSEFLPVSSSGHLLLSQYFLGMDQKRFGLSFDAAIHTGTVLAVVRASSASLEPSVASRILVGKMLIPSPLFLRR